MQVVHVLEHITQQNNKIYAVDVLVINITLEQMYAPFVQNKCQDV